MGMLTQARVERLMSDLSGRVRAETAAIVAGEFASGHLSDTDRRIAEDIIAVLARDAEIQVRESIAEHLKSCPLLPREIALELAYDIETVAVPILQFSRSLTEEDLIDIVRIGPTAKQVAIARRPNIGIPVTDVLVETGCSTVVGAMLENNSADISDISFFAVVAALGREQHIQERLVNRPRLPVSAIRELICHVSDELAARLILKHDIPPQITGQILNQGREGAIARLIAGNDEAVTAEALAKLKGSVTPTLLVRCLCLGKLHFVEAAMAALAEIPLDNARILMSDPGPLGVQSLYRKAGLPPALMNAVRVAISVSVSRTKNGLPMTADDLTRGIIERLLHEYREISPGNLEHVLAELSRISRQEAAGADVCAVH